MDIPPAGGRNGGGGAAGVGYQCLLPPEHSHTNYCNQAHYVTLSGGGAEARVKGEQAVVVAVRIGYGGDVDGESGGGTDEGGGGVRTGLRGRQNKLVVR